MEQFEFDPEKSRSNRDKHGLEFVWAQGLWDVTHAIIPAKNVRGENRFVILAEIEGKCWAASGQSVATGRIVDWSDFMKAKSRRKARTRITAEEFDAKFDRGEDISGFLDLKTATVVQRVNVDFPSWMVEMLDREALKLNVSRQAIIKMWIRERLDPAHRVTL